MALINADDLNSRAAAQGAIELAKKKGLQVVFVDAYPERNTDFSAILTKVRPEELAANQPRFPTPPWSQR